MSVSLNETETPDFHLVLFCVMLCDTLGSEEGEKKPTALMGQPRLTEAILLGCDVCFCIYAL